MAKTKKERRMSKKFSMIKKELKRQGLDVSKVNKSQKLIHRLKIYEKIFFHRLENITKKKRLT